MKTRLPALVVLSLTLIGISTVRGFGYAADALRDEVPAASGSRAETTPSETPAAAPAEPASTPQAEAAAIPPTAMQRHGFSDMAAIYADLPPQRAATLIAGLPIADGAALLAAMPKPSAGAVLTEMDDETAIALTIAMTHGDPAD